MRPRDQDIQLLEAKLANRIDKLTEHHNKEYESFHIRLTELSEKCATLSYRKLWLERFIWLCIGVIGTGCTLYFSIIQNISIIDVKVNYLYTQSLETHK
jgi:hypothetical protein